MNLRYGKADENVLKRSVADVILHEGQKSGTGQSSHIKNGKSSDGRGFVPSSDSLSDDAAEKTKTGISVLTLSEKNAGGLAVVRAVNSLAAERIRARVFCPVILLPPGTQEEKLREIMSQICSAAFSLNVEVRPGHIEVTDAVTRPVITGSASGTFFSNPEQKPPGNKSSEQASPGQKPPGNKSPEQVSPVQKSSGQASPEQFSGKVPQGKKEKTGPEIVAAGWIGMEGTLILTADCRERMRKRFPASLLARTDLPPEELSVLKAAEIAAAEGAGHMVNLSDGGFMAGLWELSKKTERGLDIDLKKVPILQETIEITEFAGVNPYLMKSEGCLLITARDGDRMAEHLMEEGIFASKIGFLNDTKDKIIRNGDEIRHLDRPQTDSLAMYFFTS
jgi:hydrogenase maturation factor